MLDLVEEFRSIVTALDAAGVPFAVCGGLAVAVYSQPRATVDVDLLLPRDQIEGCKEVARGLGYTIEAGPMVIRPEHRMSKADEESGDLLSIDLLAVTQELEPVWAGRVRVGWEHGELPVVSRAGLIQMKRLRGSGQDHDDIRNLEESDDGEDRHVAEGGDGPVAPDFAAPPPRPSAAAPREGRGRRPCKGQARRDQVA